MNYQTFPIKWKFSFNIISLQNWSKRSVCDIYTGFPFHNSGRGRNGSPPYMDWVRKGGGSSMNSWQLASGIIWIKVRHQGTRKVNILNNLGQKT